MVNLINLVVSALAFAAVGVSAKSPQPPQSEIHPRSAGLTSRDHIQVERMTNAKRLAAGQPLLPPRRRNHADLAARTQPSSSPTPGRSITGFIQVTNTRTGEFIGYISKGYVLFGEYGPVKKRKDALKIKLEGITNGKSGPLQMVNKNGDQTYRNVGAITGFWNTNDALAPGSKSYVYIGGVAQTAPGAPPQIGGSAFKDATGADEKIESAVWYFNTRNRKITLGWVNPDGSIASNAKLIFYPADNVIFGVADVPTFKKEFGEAIPVTFTLVDD